MAIIRVMEVALVKLVTRRNKGKMSTGGGRILVWLRMGGQNRKDRENSAKRVPCRGLDIGGIRLAGR